MFGKLINYQVNDNIIEIQFENKVGKIEIVTPSIIRIFANMDGINRKSIAIENVVKEPSVFEIINENNRIIINTEKISAYINDDFKIDIYDDNGNLLCEDYRYQRKKPHQLSPAELEILEKEGHLAENDRNQKFSFEVVKNLKNVQQVYGLGDKTGFLNKMGYAYEMWNTDNPAPHVDCFKTLYKSIPFFIVMTENSRYGIFNDNTYYTYLDFGKENAEYYYFASSDGNLDYYFIAGDSIQKIIMGYAKLTGTAPLPQLFTLGYQQSRWGYESESEIRNLAAMMRKHQIPCDVIHLDIDYMDHFKVFTWNKDNYDNPRKMIQDLAEDGFKIVTIIDPGVKAEENYKVYDEGIQNDYFAKNPDETIYHNEVWPGDSVYPDFGNARVRNWWADQQKFLLDMGVRGVWNDMNEPASFKGPLPDDVVFRLEERSTNHKEVHNVYGHFMAKATYEGLKKYDKRRPFVITRASFAGTQKYSTAWTGDNHSIWAHLQMAIPQQCNLSLSGMPNVGTDIGGFGADTTEELMARWIQVGCFSPLFRNHSAKGTRYQEPWQFSEKVLNIYRKYVELRYRIIPYYYDLFFKGERTGLPILRPLVLHYENDLETRNLNDQFMVGEYIIVAPVVNQGSTKRLVYLPEGEWFEYHTKNKIYGGKYIVVDAPLDICPIYVKAGAIIPVYPKMQYVGEQSRDQLILNIYEGEGKYTHYLDDGETFNYQDGKYNEYVFEIDKIGRLTIECTHNGYEYGYKSFVIHYQNQQFVIPFSNEKIEYHLQMS